MEGARRWLERVVRLYDESETRFFDQNDPVLAKAFARCVRDVENDLERDGWNTPVSAMMVFINECYKHKALNRADMVGFLSVFSLYAPHLADELHERMGGRQSVFASPWPRYDPELLVEEQLTIAVQVDGRLRAAILVDASSSEDSIVARALRDEHVAHAIGQGKVVRTVYVPKRLVNFVLGE